MRRIFFGGLTTEILELEQVFCTGPVVFLAGWGWETLCIKLADLHPRQDNLLQRHSFSGVYKTSFHFTKLGGYQLKKHLFFQTCTHRNHTPRSRIVPVFGRKKSFLRQL
jgi:hypothetical protein